MSHKRELHDTTDGAHEPAAKRSRTAAETVSLQLAAAPLIGNTRPPPARFFETDETVKREERLARENAQLPVESPNGRTYVLSGFMGLDHAHLRAIMRSHGWREVAVTEPRADFVWAELYASRYDPRAYRVRCVLKNVLHDDRKRVVTDKARLHDLVRARDPEVASRLMAATRPLREVDAVGEGEVLILRPAGVWARAGNGIVRVCSTEELLEARERMLPKLEDAIASSYIVDHLLWEGRKFHMRTYWLVCAPVGSARPFTWELWRRAKVLTAAKPFVRGEWWDRAVHDTHVKSTPRNLFFPEDLTLPAGGADTVYASMKEVLAVAAEVLRPNAVPFDESEYAYEVFGADFLITSDLRAVLMEVNSRIGFSCIGDDADGRYAQFAKDYYTWVFEHAIQPMSEAAAEVAAKRASKHVAATH